MEVIPCGPIHPYVIKEAGLDPEVFSGFAWGFGLDRLIMIKRGINDVRHFHSGKLDFLNQF
jgi:phenylalanyl-tRNA synthetase alpha chain